MNFEEFFDLLYSDYCVPFPCYALLGGGGRGYITEVAPDGSKSLVLLTDEDLMQRYQTKRPVGPTIPVALEHPRSLASLVDTLPAEITHVTFDPAPKFHRRYPVSVIRASLPQATH